MTKPSPAQQVEELRQKAIYKRRAEDGYLRFVADMRAYGKWSDADVAEYRDNVKILMGKDDAAALALYPDGLYKTAREARDAAMQFWVEWK